MIAQQVCLYETHLVKRSTARFFSHAACLNRPPNLLY